VGRLIRPAVLGASALALAGAMTLTAAVALGGAPDVGTTAPGTREAGAGTTTDDRPGSSITALQQRLRTVPGDHRAWSSLALTYVEQARVTADPSYYPKAAKAVARAARLAPGDSVMLTARASLEAARHDFHRALRDADAAIEVNPYSAPAFAIRSDALTELGRYAEARRAAARADDLEPGPSTFARLSYQAELRGDLRAATRLMRLSLHAATSGAPSYAFASFHLGELARTAGDLRAAKRHYDAALGADPTYAPAIAGRARIAAAHGNIAGAVRDYREVVGRLPLTEYVVELADLYLATGQPDLAAQQIAVAETSAALQKANGVRTDLETALLEADHGSPVAALEAAESEWAARHTVHTADAMAWALHASGRDRDALGYARRATALGTRDARLLFHRGAIEAALDMAGPARAHLRAALRIDSGVAPLREQQARDLLGAI
jgi:tetratricopeptide (TPR) repeat protein